MRQWVVKLLGGFTAEEFDLCRCEANSRVEVVQEQLQNAREVLQLKDNEIQRLTDLMLTRAGFLAPALTSQTENKHEPINRRLTWQQRQKELEKADAKKMADQTETYWKEKTAESNAS